jgi:hypothetical protein
MSDLRSALRLLSTLSLGLCAACSSPHVAKPPPGVVVFTGMCDASGAVPISRNTFAVANDEDNAIRVYDADRGGAPLRTVDLSQPLKLLPKRAGKPPPESDIEAGTIVGELAFWLTSHGRSASGKLKPERHRFFATKVAQAGASSALVGQSYDRLLDDLLAEPAFAAFGLAEASERAPKSQGGLNIEGMTARGDGSLIIGFRSPVPRGRALIAPLLNPEAVVSRGERSRFGAPITLDLDGLGIRGLSTWRGSYLILAGAEDSEATTRLYQWDGVSAPKRLPVDLSSFNAEGFVSVDERGEVLLLSDDGTVEIDGKECKRLADAARMRFRGLWLSSDKLSPQRSGAKEEPASPR